MQKITPFLWFESEAEEAAEFYASIFEDSSVGRVTRYGAEGPGPEGSVMTVPFRIAGQEFVALNGGPHFKFSPAISFVVNCETQEEVDRFWKKLSEGGSEEQCGWVTDRFGLSWQIVPAAMGRLFDGVDPAASSRAMKAMLRMKKLDIAALERAYAGE